MEQSNADGDVSDVNTELVFYVNGKKVRNTPT